MLLPAAACQTVDAAEVKYRLTVEGMTCAVGCAPKVKQALEGIDGVRSVDVDFETQTAVVTALEGTELTVESCDRSFGNDGYFVSELVALAKGEDETQAAPEPTATH